jgi:hypothetical protein
MRLILATALLWVFSCANATPVAEAELKKIDEIQSQLNVKKDWAKFRYDEASAACYTKFFTDSCLKDARAIYRKETLDIRNQELPMHDRQRELKETLKTERDQKRRLESQDPKKAAQRADNKKAFEEKQEKMIERTLDLEERRKDAAKRAQENRQTSPF